MPDNQLTVIGSHLGGYKNAMSSCCCARQSITNNGDGIRLFGLRWVGRRGSGYAQMAKNEVSAKFLLESLVSVSWINPALCVAQ